MLEGATTLTASRPRQWYQFNQHAPLERSEGDAQPRAESHVTRPGVVDVDPVIRAFHGDGVRSIERKERVDAALKAVVGLFARIRFLPVESGADEEAGVAVGLGEAVLDDAIRMLDGAVAVDVEASRGDGEGGLGAHPPHFDAKQ